MQTNLLAEMKNNLNNVFLWHAKISKKFAGSRPIAMTTLLTSLCHVPKNLKGNLGVRNTRVKKLFRQCLEFKEKQ